MSAVSRRAGDRKGVVVYQVDGVFGTSKLPVKVFVGRDSQKRAAAYAARYGQRNHCGTVLGPIKVNDD